MELSLFFLFIYRILVPVFLVLPYYMVNKDEYKSALKTATRTRQRNLCKIARPCQQQLSSCYRQTRGTASAGYIRLAESQVR